MNQKIAEILYELSVIYDIMGVPFKPRALERASQVIAELDEDVRDIYGRDGEEGLEHIPGVGKGIAERIVEYLTTHRVKEHKAMKKKLPVRIAEIMAIEGIGPKTLLLLYKKFGITTRAKLEKFARAGKLAGVRGIGSNGQDRILRSIGYLSQSQDRFLPGIIWSQIRAITDRIESWPHVRHLELVGSFRRMQETIGDLDMLAISDDAEDTLRRFVSMPQVLSVNSHGDRNALVRLKMGMDADLWVIPEESYGASLIAWTGSKAHNIHLRILAKKKGYLLDDYGLFKDDEMIAGHTEQDVYQRIGLQWIPPELRTDSGEIEVAAKKKLPKLVDLADVRGDLQVHTDWTDGQDSILAMAKAARSAGLDYIAITDHTKSLTIAHGLDEKKLKLQWSEIDRVQKGMSGIKILKGAECDIKKNGSLDLPDAVLAELDVVGAAVHSHFDMSERDQTARIVRAINNPYADILFHPTGRIIQRRSPYAVDIGRVIAEAARTGTILEANAHPGRLDLKDEYIKKAITAGVRVSIDTDAHAIGELLYMRWGVGQARRGWARPSDIVNTRPWRSMLRLLKKRQCSTLEML